MRRPWTGCGFEHSAGERGSGRGSATARARARAHQPPRPAGSLTQARGHAGRERSHDENAAPLTTMQGQSLTRAASWALTVLEVISCESAAIRGHVDQGASSGQRHRVAVLCLWPFFVAPSALDVASCPAITKTSRRHRRRRTPAYGTREHCELPTTTPKAL